MPCVLVLCVCGWEEGEVDTSIPVIPELLPCPIGNPFLLKGPFQTALSPTWPSSLGLLIIISLLSIAIVFYCCFNRLKSSGPWSVS